MMVLFRKETVFVIKIVRESIFNHLMENNIITPHQHGFLPGRSCITKLLESLDEWNRILEDNGSVDIIYTDFQKAFDSVLHKRLAQKLNACGIRGSLLDWIVDFLDVRKQKVVINGCESTEGRVTSGILQGSVFGTLLFVIYINDLWDKPISIHSFSTRSFSIRSFSISI